MNYTYIKDTIVNFLTTNNYFDQEEILAQSQIPSQNLSMFCRIFWTYGQSIPYTNKSFQQPCILNLEIFELKNTQNNTIEDLSISLRKDLLNNFFSFKNSSEVAKIISISVSKNNNDTDWNGCNLIISFTNFN